MEVVTLGAERKFKAYGGGGSLEPHLPFLRRRPVQPPFFATLSVQDDPGQCGYLLEQKNTSMQTKIEPGHPRLSPFDLP